MASGTAMTKAAPVKYWALDDPADMYAAIAGVIEYDYTGTAGAFKDGNGLSVWEMNLQGPQPLNLHVTAHLGDVLVWDEVSLKAMRIEVFQDQYDTD